MGAAATGNVVRGNSIGTDASGTIVRGNSGNGITIRSGANGNTIGGTQRAARNVISGNGTGISVSNAGTTNNTILGNVIGTDRSGLLDFGNGGVGITIFSSASGNTIGGTTIGARNIISGNGTRGILLNGPSTTGNVVLGNYIGVDSTGVAILRNDQEGIQISGAAHDNTVGGTVGRRGEHHRRQWRRWRLRDRSQHGRQPDPRQRDLRQPRASASISGPTACRPTTAPRTARCPTSGMDFPVFTTAILAGANLHVAGYVGSAPGQSAFANARVEIFRSDNDATGHGEGPIVPRLPYLRRFRWLLAEACRPPV